MYVPFDLQSVSHTLWQFFWHFFILWNVYSVAYVSRSGGMSNELNNIISHTTNGVYEGVAIGGDRYPGTTFMDHVLRYHDNPDVKMIVVLGEVYIYSTDSPVQNVVFHTSTYMYTMYMQVPPFDLIPSSRWVV